jgi:hypothetical protein
MYGITTLAIETCLSFPQKLIDEVGYAYPLPFPLPSAPPHDGDTNGSSRPGLVPRRQPLQRTCLPPARDGAIVGEYPEGAGGGLRAVDEGEFDRR